MERDLLEQRITRLISLPNAGGVFRDGLAMYERAKAFATNVHAGQTYGARPFTYHLEQVENVLIRFDYCSFGMRAAAWLHDTVAECNATAEDIHREFPGVVGVIVSSMTCRRSKELGPNTVVLNLADRIANVEEGILTGDHRLCTSEEESSEFRDALYESGHADAMWAHLDTLNEFGAEALKQRSLTAFANGVSSSKARSINETASLSDISRPT
jgi:guanosine-3',5'-bis(diphosphate) 3'-pyrophosphohydrolase